MRDYTQLVQDGALYLNVRARVCFCVSRLGLGRVLKVQTKGVVFIWFVPVQPFAGYGFQPRVVE